MTIENDAEPVEPESKDPQADAYREGLDAVGAGTSPDECPYDGGTDEFMAWKEGYSEGMEQADNLRSEGYDARKDGSAASRCSHKEGTPGHKFWHEGYAMRKKEEADEEEG